MSNHFFFWVRLDQRTLKNSSSKSEQLQIIISTKSVTKASFNRHKHLLSTFSISRDLFPLHRPHLCSGFVAGISGRIKPWTQLRGKLRCLGLGNIILLTPRDPPAIDTTLPETNIVFAPQKLNGFQARNLLFHCCPYFQGIC